MNNHPDKNVLAFEWAANLLTDAEKQRIVMDDELCQLIKDWQTKLLAFNNYAPLTQQQSEHIWQTIEQHTSQQQKHSANFIARLLAKWQGWQILPKWQTWQFASFALVLTLSVILVPIMINQTTVPIVNVANAWVIEKDMDNQRILVQTMTAPTIPEGKVCVLWVKQNNQLAQIGILPDQGSKALPISSKVMPMLENSEMIISIENKGKMPAQPSQIDYIGNWS